MTIAYQHNAQERVALALRTGNAIHANLIAQIAQAEATLALVEQQRIANLIAYSSHRCDHRSAIGLVGDDAYPRPMQAVLSHADSEIREGLGL